MRLLGYVRTPTAAHRILDVATQRGVTGDVRVKFGADRIFADLHADPAPHVMLIDAALARPDCGTFTYQVLKALPRGVVMIVGQFSAMAAAQAVAASASAPRGSCCLFPSKGEDDGFLAAVLAAVGLVASSRHGTGHRASRQAVELTGRELQVLAGLADGRSCEDIGRDLTLSKETVKTHVRRLYRKLGASDRANAVAIAFRSGLIR